MRKNLLFIVTLMLFGIVTANAQYIVFDDVIVNPDAKLDNAAAGSVNEITDVDAFTGTSSIQLMFDGAAAPKTWCMLLITSAVPVDLSEYTEGYLNFAMKTTSTSSFNVRITDGTNKPKIMFVDGADPYEFVRDGEWHTVSIPIQDFVNATTWAGVQTDFNLAAIKDLFVFRSGSVSDADWIATEATEFFFDEISISNEPFVNVDVKNIALNTVDVYPNPATNMITVKGVTSLKADIMSVTGQVVKTVNQSSNQLNVSDLHNGVYFLSIKSEGKSFVKRFIKN